jgi:hypothetical protein
MLRLSTESCEKGTHPKCVAVVTFGKTESVEDDRPETGVRSATSDMYAIDRYEVLLVPSVGIIPIQERYRVSFFTALVPQVQ